MRLMIIVLLLGCGSSAVEPEFCDKQAAAEWTFEGKGEKPIGCFCEEFLDPVTRTTQRACGGLR